jgi:NADP-dependent 3-hydroxy acid dehydrogenase YdfG
VNDRSTLLAEKVALVTGASSGIGEATALALARDGAHVAAVARRADRLEAVVERIRAAGGSATAITADVTVEAQVCTLVERAATIRGRIDILVNNAGTAVYGLVDGGNTEDWRRMVDVNVMALLYMTHEVLPLMKRRRDGHIVNISSVAGRIARVGSAVYNLTKWGVTGFSEALRQEVLAENIRVTVIEPGFVTTEIWEQTSDPGWRERLTSMIAATTPLSPADVAAAIRYAVTQPPHVNVNEILMRPLLMER